LSAYNFTVPVETVAQAIKRVQGYTFDERIRRFDDVAQRQMPVLCAGLDLKHHAIPMRLVDHALQVILILFEIFELAAPTLPTVSQQAVQREFDQLAEAIRFFGGEPNPWKLIEIFLQEFPEHTILASVVGYLQEHVNEPTREHLFVVQCCFAVTYAYVKTYREWLQKP